MMFVSGFSWVRFELSGQPQPDSCLRLFLRAMSSPSRSPAQVLSRSCRPGSPNSAQASSRTTGSRSMSPRLVETFLKVVTLFDLLLIELFLRLSHVKQMYTQPVHLTNQLVLNTQITSKGYTLMEILLRKVLAGFSFWTFWPRSSLICSCTFPAGFGHFHSSSLLVVALQYLSCVAYRLG